MTTLQWIFERWGYPPKDLAVLYARPQSAYSRTTGKHEQSGYVDVFPQCKAGERMPLPINVEPLTLKQAREFAERCGAKLDETGLMPGDFIYGGGNFPPFTNGSDWYVPAYPYGPFTDLSRPGLVIVDGKRDLRDMGFRPELHLWRKEEVFGWDGYWSPNGRTIHIEEARRACRRLAEVYAEGAEFKIRPRRI